MNRVRVCLCETNEIQHERTAVFLLLFFQDASSKDFAYQAVFRLSLCTAARVAVYWLDKWLHSMTSFPLQP